MHFKMKRTRFLGGLQIVSTHAFSATTFIFLVDFRSKCCHRWQHHCSLQSAVGGGAWPWSQLLAAVRSADGGSVGDGAWSWLAAHARQRLVCASGRAGIFLERDKCESANALRSAWVLKRSKKQTMKRKGPGKVRVNCTMHQIVCCALITTATLAAIISNTYTDNS